MSLHVDFTPEKHLTRKGDFTAFLAYFVNIPILSQGFVSMK